MTDDVLFYTLAQPNSLQQEIKKSRFLAHAGPIGSIEAAMAFVAGHSVAAANHNCWAYRIGDAYRFSDDGEPAGTAGRPILHAIESQRCDRVAVLVVRWFGGIKLGAGGLARAYGGAAAQCLRSGPRVPVIDRVRVSCRCAFGDLAMVRARFDALQVLVSDERFDASGVHWQLAVPRAHLPALAGQFAGITRGQGAWRELDPGVEGYDSPG